MLAAVGYVRLTVLTAVCSLLLPRRDAPTESWQARQRTSRTATKTEWHGGHESSTAPRGEGPRKHGSGYHLGQNTQGLPPIHGVSRPPTKGLSTGGQFAV